MSHYPYPQVLVLMVKTLPFRYIETVKVLSFLLDSRIAPANYRSHFYRDHGCAQSVFINNKHEFYWPDEPGHVLQQAIEAFGTRCSFRQRKVDEEQATKRDSGWFWGVLVDFDVLDGSVSRKESELSRSLSFVV